MNASAVTPLFCASVFYPYQEGASFDYEQYANHLLPEYVKIIGANCVRFEVRKGLTIPGARQHPTSCVL